MPPASRPATTTEAYLVSGIGGCVDAIGVITLGGLFVSHMSGNTAALGALLGQGQWTAGWPHLFAIPAFVVGLFLGYLWTGQQPSLRRCAIIFLSEAFLLTVFGLGYLVTGGPAPDNPAYFLLATAPLLAMGLQNATLRQIGRSAFPSTYVTGVLDRFAQTAAECWRKRGTAEAANSRADALSALGIWIAYVTGALIGGAGLLAFRPAVLVLPIGILLILAIRLLREKNEACRVCNGAPGG